VEAEKDALQKHQQVSVAREEENRRLRHQLEKLEVERQDLRSRVQRMLDLVSGIDH
jgi:predicted nucleotide-binding protein (sugar kinase/HSP70/actin superfamily)